MKQTIRVTINGQLYEENVEPRLLLSHFLLENLGLTDLRRLRKRRMRCLFGAPRRQSCEILSALRRLSRWPRGYDGGRPGQKRRSQFGSRSLHQKLRFSMRLLYAGHGMTSYALLPNNPNPSKEEIRKALAGNLCMCTGYVQIVDAVKEAARGSKSWINSSARYFLKTVKAHDSPVWSLVLVPYKVSFIFVKCIL